MELNIEPRRDYLGWQCVFEHKGQEYLADITIMPDYETECMIFKSHGGQFTFEDAMGVYTNYDVDFSPEGLEECIRDFISL